jgi:hypothetical protein
MNGAVPPLLYASVCAQEHLIMHLPEYNKALCLKTAILITETGSALQAVCQVELPCSWLKII